MNADAFRHIYEYHFKENRTLWDSLIMPLPQEQFIQPILYSVGSVHNQIVHMISVDDSWFTSMRGLDIPYMLEPDDFEDKATIRAYWDKVEQTMRDYLATLSDDMLFQKPFTIEEDKDLMLWHALFQVANHGTDHRAQVLRLLHDFGAKTTSQDYIFYAYDNP